MTLACVLCRWLLAATVMDAVYPAVAADGGWQAQGYAVTLSRRGQTQSSPPQRAAVKLPTGARVTSLYWRIVAAPAVPAQATLAICMPGKCVKLDGFAGRTDAFNGMAADNPVTLLIKAEGHGALMPPWLLKHYMMQVNYQSHGAR